MAMGPLNFVVPPIYKICALSSLPRLDFNLNVPKLKELRKEGLNMEVRMVRMSAAKIVQAWPNSLQFLVNDKELFAVKPADDGHKRRDVPERISVGLASGANKITVRAKDDQISDYVMAIVATKPQSIEELQKRVCRCDATSGKKRVQRLISGSRKETGDGEITCLSSNMLKLTCPISMERIADSPVRGVECEHLQ